MTESTNLELVKQLTDTLSSLNQHIAWLEKTSDLNQKDRYEYVEQLVSEANSFISLGHSNE
jgi:hypothetical protein